MFKKVNIVESNTPPTNKHDWWYDLNYNALKRYYGGSWILVNSSESGSTIELPEELTTSCITIDLYEPGTTSIYTNGEFGWDIIDYSNDGYRALLSSSTSELKSPSGHVVSIDYNDSGEVDGPFIGAIYIPNETEILPPDFVEVGAQLSSQAIENIFIGTGIKDIQRGAFTYMREYNGLQATNLYIYASNPPTLDVGAFMTTDGSLLPLGDLTVYVPGAYYDKYINDFLLMCK